MSGLYVMPSNSNELIDRMNEYRLLSEAEYIMIAHNGGSVIAESGQLEFSDNQMFAALIAASFSSTTQIAQIIGEGQGFSHVIQMGKKRSIFMGAVNENSVAVFVVPGDKINPVLYDNMGRWLAELQSMMGNFGETSSIL